MRFIDMGVLTTSVGATDFASVVRQRSWDWLAALQRRLNITRLQIVDEQGSLLVPDATPSWTTTLRKPEVAATLAQALESKVPESIRLGSVQLACVSLTVGQARGAMLLTRTVNDSTAARDRAELELMGSWLRPAVEAHLASAPANGADHTPRVSSLFRVLNSAAHDGNEQTLLELCANALAIWHDVDMRAYVEDIEGNFRLQVSLPGAQAVDAPSLLHGTDVSIGEELTRASSRDLEVFGLRATDEAMAARIGDAKEGHVWLLVLSGGVDAAGESRLALYTDVLQQALQNVAASSLLSLERRIWRQLVSASDSMERAAEAALGQLRGAVGTGAAALSITFRDGQRLLHVGDSDVLTGPAAPERFVKTVQVEPGRTLSIGLARPKAGYFTSHDQKTVEAISQLIGSWAGGVLQRTANVADRRVASRSFEDVLERTAVQATAYGSTASVIVLKMNGNATRPGVAQKVATELRAYLRAGEPVGALDASEIGLLLYDSTPDVARSVVKRLRSAVAGGEVGSQLASASVGMAHCGPGLSPMVRLVTAARQDALQAHGDMAVS